MSENNKPVPTVRESIHAAINSEADVATKANHPENEKIQKVTADHNAAEAQKDKAARAVLSPKQNRKPATKKSKTFTTVFVRLCNARNILLRKRTINTNT